MKPANTSNSLSVIIPMYNEEKGAEKCIDAVLKVLKHEKTQIKLLVINDGSQDETEKILQKKQLQYPELIVVSYKRNKGYGGALRTGIQEAFRRGFTYALFMDSDLTNDPKYIADFVKVIPKGYDCVKASRFVKGGEMVGVPRKRTAFSVIGNIVASSLFQIGIKDCTNGFRMVKLSLLHHIQYKENSFPIILEELYWLKKIGASFYEIPTILTARKNSKSSFQYTPTMLYRYFSYAVKAALL